MKRALAERSTRETWTVIEPKRESSLPRWARAADVAAIAIVIVAIIVAATGGFRLWFGAWRFALTSPYHPLLLAAAIAIVRHALVREQPIHAHVRLLTQQWSKSVALREAAAVFAGSRPAIYHESHQKMQ